MLLYLKENSLRDALEDDEAEPTAEFAKAVCAARASGMDASGVKAAVRPAKTASVRE